MESGLPTLNSEEAQINWFGYKLHVVYDTSGEIILAFKLTPANKSDSEHALSLIEEAVTKLPEMFSYYLLDKGYDAKNIYEATAEEYSGDTIIALNLRNSKQPKAGHYDFKGTPECSGDHKMTYWGHDSKYNKFRCLHATGKVNCCHGMRWYTDSNYGLVVKTRPKDDYRFISLPHWNSKTWQKIYNERTSVERVFFRLKENFNLENITITGRRKAKAHVRLSIIAHLAGKIAVARKQRMEKAAAA